MKKLSTGLLALTMAFAVSACAKKPESIAPAYTSTSQYNGWSCKTLSNELQNIDRAYASAADQQNNARSNDIIGVILIGLPVSSLSGDNIAPQIATLKGQREAIRSTMITKRCAGSGDKRPIS
ncbi:hypothetical protein [Pseudovibrio sp. Tun.PSC04-5.I4]|uniref:hypothetical protein n=1 Tax=Pseudovibrio sp. Tun.PSC04-5.I4 TaxID=1798213 RepID=UPI000888DFFE|nr:hypothetical protein [Pseudovibrio sp. Tun.PSC04-5.I4]SDQ18272.1 hypothetical protein SAMN04515695_0366 [Pseudovibrio sp. Tun.PSC04-5.I4]